MDDERAAQDRSLAPAQGVPPVGEREVHPTILARHKLDHALGGTEDLPDAFGLAPTAVAVLVDLQPIARRGHEPEPLDKSLVSG